MGQGVPSDKLILGVPFYGRVFTLADPGSNGVGAPIAGENTALAYSDICGRVQQGGWNVVFDEGARVPYAYMNNQWISYDNVQ